MTDQTWSDYFISAHSNFSAFGSFSFRSPNKHHLLNFRSWSQYQIILYMFKYTIPTTIIRIYIFLIIGLSLYFVDMSLLTIWISLYSDMFYLDSISMFLWIYFTFGYMSFIYHYSDIIVPGFVLPGYSCSKYVPFAILIIFYS